MKVFIITILCVLSLMTISITQMPLINASRGLQCFAYNHTALIIHFTRWTWQDSEHLLSWWRLGREPGGSISLWTLYPGQVLWGTASSVCWDAKWRVLGSSPRAGKTWKVFWCQNTLRALPRYLWQTHKFSYELGTPSGGTCFHPLWTLPMSPPKGRSGEEHTGLHDY